MYGVDLVVLGPDKLKAKEDGKKEESTELKPGF